MQSDNKVLKPRPVINLLNCVTIVYVTMPLNFPRMTMDVMRALGFEAKKKEENIDF